MSICSKWFHEESSLRGSSCAGQNDGDTLHDDFKHLVRFYTMRSMHEMLDATLLTLSTTGDCWVRMAKKIISNWMHNKLHSPVNLFIHDNRCMQAITSNPPPCKFLKLYFFHNASAQLLSLSLSHTHPYIGSYTGHTNHLYAIFTIRMRFLLHIIKEIRKKWSRFIALKSWSRR